MNIIYYIRFTYIQPYKIIEVEEQNLNVKRNTINNIINNNIIEKETVISKNIELNPNRSPEKKIYSNESNSDRQFPSSSRKFDQINEIKEAPLEEEQSHNEQKTNNKIIDLDIGNKNKINENNVNNNENNNVNVNANREYLSNINIDNPLNDIKIQNKSIGQDTENDDDIISNPYREDFIINDQKNIGPSDEINKKENNTFITKILGKKNEKNNVNSHLKIDNKKDGFSIKNITNENEIDTHRRLSSFGSLGSDEFRMNSIDSRYPINSSGIKNNINIGNNNHYLNEIIGNKYLDKFNNSELYSHKKENEEENISNNNKKDNDSEDDDEDDNSSVIQNPFRDDIHN